MPNYKEEAVNGNKWTRCNRIEIHNPYVGQKSVTFYEQEIVQISNTDVLQRNTGGIGPGSLTTSFDANTIISIIDPYTLQPTGQTFTHAELYVMLFSAYMDLALKRDTPE